MIVKIFTITLLAFVSVFSISGCGGNDESEITKTQVANINYHEPIEEGEIKEEQINKIEKNRPPLAYVGRDEKIEVGDLFQLESMNIPDQDGDLLNYLWTIVEKPADSVARLSNRISRTPTFVADTFGSYTFRLMIDDGDDYAFDMITISTYLRSNDFSASIGTDDTNVSVNWKNLSDTNDKDAIAIVKTQGEYGICEVNGDMVTYTETVDNNITDICTLEVSNDEESIDINISIVKKNSVEGRLVNTHSDYNVVDHWEFTFEGGILEIDTLSEYPGAHPDQIDIDNNGIM